MTGKSAKVSGILLAVMLLVGVTPAASAQAQNPTVGLFEDDSVEISYRHVNSAGDRYHAEITIVNVSDTAISDWKLLMDIGYTVTDVSTATLISQTGRQLLVGSGNPHKVIKPGHKVKFKFWAEAAGDSAIEPPAFAFLLEDGILPTTDSDSDLMPDYIELQAGTSPHLADTDGDGLSDFVEWAIRTNPLSIDTDGNGILDAQEDPDADSVVNIDEIAAGTYPLQADSDGDKLTDGEELVWQTNPLVQDTDGDGVGDGSEVEIGSNPLVAEIAFDVARSAAASLTSVSVSIEGLGPEQVETFSITPLPAGQTQFPEDTPGYIDQGYEFQISGGFTEAAVTFKLDPSLQGLEDFDPAIYTYDDESQRLIEVPNQTATGDTVTATVSHFSKYILLNRLTFNTVWLYTFLEEPDEEHAYERLDVVFTIDSSGSMSSNDPRRERIQVAKNFVERLGENDRAAVVDFDSSAIVRSGLSNDKAALSSALDLINASGGTNIGAGVSTALGVFDPPVDGTLRTVILLTDGQGSYDQTLTTQAANSEVVIHTVGLGSGVDANLLTGIATQTGGKYYPASDAEQLATIFQSISDASDLLRDSDGDGINDYYEKEMRAGHLVLGNGVPIGLMDYLNPDSDGDGVSDGEEVSIRRVDLNSAKTLTYAFLRSNPLIIDTDGDGMSDFSDPLPLVSTRSEMLIHQSANREGLRKEPNLEKFQVPHSTTVADDLTYNDYTTNELRELGAIFYVAPITPEFMMWGEFSSMLEVGKIGADGDHQAIVDHLYGEFRNGHGGVASGSVGVEDDYNPSNYHEYSSQALNRAVGESPQMQRYVNKSMRLIVESITANKGGTAQFAVQDDLNRNLLYGNFDKAGVKYPVYDWSLSDANERALSIAIHQFHGQQIRLTDYNVTGNSFSGTLIYRSYDHFGLDADDEIEHYGFVDWFTLQHYDRFNGKYVPALTVVEIEVPFSGTF